MYFCNCNFFQPECLWYDQFIIGSDNSHFLQLTFKLDLPLANNSQQEQRLHVNSTLMVVGDRSSSLPFTSVWSYPPPNPCQLPQIFSCLNPHSILIGVVINNPLTILIDSTRFYNNLIAYLHKGRLLIYIILSVDCSHYHCNPVDRNV